VTSPEPVTHPALDLDDAVHQKTRLALLTVVDEAQRADFPYLKRTLALTDGNLGRHLDVLAQQGLVHITKGYEGRRPRTWAAITPEGRTRPRRRDERPGGAATPLPRQQNLRADPPIGSRFVW
jgi:hypothetical protein